MSLVSIAVVVLLVFGVAVELACCLGVLVMDGAYNKLHFLGPAAIVGPLAIAAAVVVQESFSQAGIKALLTAGLLIVASPVLSHATARALYIRQRDHVEPELVGHLRRGLPTSGTGPDAAPVVGADMGGPGSDLGLGGRP